MRAADHAERQSGHQPPHRNPGAGQRPNQLEHAIILAVLRRAGKKFTYRELWSTCTDTERDQLREPSTVCKRLPLTELRRLTPSSARTRVYGGRLNGEGMGVVRVAAVAHSR